MHNYSKIKENLLQTPSTWLITGVAGFIGSNILEQLLLLNQKVVGIDNFFSGFEKNLLDVQNSIDSKLWDNFIFYNTDISDINSCNKIFQKYTINNTIHLAAICSVPFSIKNPELNNQVNINGFENILKLSCEYNIKNFVYASSSAVYGDESSVKLIENKTGKLLSPYATSKFEDEKIASKYSKEYNINTTGLRYFNIYGKRQNPNSAYSAVIPKWITSAILNQQIYINGDGSTTRDFCHVEDVVQANILSAVNPPNTSHTSYTSHTSQDNLNNIYNKIYNIGTGEAISLNILFNLIKKISKKHNIDYNFGPEYRNFQQGDILHSCSSIDLVTKELNFKPSYNIEKGIDSIYNWYLSHKNLWYDSSN